MAADTRYLKLRGNVWFFQYRLPRVLKDKYQRTMYTESLQTGEIKEARKRRDVLLGRLRAEADSYSGTATSLFVRKQVLLQAEIYRQTESEAQASDPELSITDMLDTDRLSPLGEDALRLALGHSMVLKKYRVTLLGALEESVQEVSAKPTTTSKHRRAATLFLQSLGRDDIPLSESTRLQVTAFIRQQREDGKTAQTIQNYLASLSAVYQYASRSMEKGLSTNPFREHRLDAKAGVTSFAPFTRRDVDAILSGSNDLKGINYLLPRLGLYSGARIGELVNLKVGDVFEAEGVPCLNIAEGKNANARRQIPIHSSVLAAVLQQRGFAQELGSAWLFPEVASVNRSDGKVSQRFSQDFARRRQKWIPMDGRKLGFHSFRVSFITAMARAGIPEADVVWVTGHEKGQTTAYGVYHRGLPMARLREIVETFSPDLLDP